MKVLNNEKRPDGFESFCQSWAYNEKNFGKDYPTTLLDIKDLSDGFDTMCQKTLAVTGMFFQNVYGDAEKMLSENPPRKYFERDWGKHNAEEVVKVLVPLSTRLTAGLFKLFEMSVKGKGNQPNGNQIVYDFTDENELKDWQKSEGSWTISNGLLVGKNSGGLLMLDLSKSIPKKTAYSVRFKVIKASGKFIKVYVNVGKTYITQLDMKYNKETNWQNIKIIGDRTIDGTVETAIIGVDCSITISKKDNSLEFTANGKPICAMKWSGYLDNLRIMGSADEMELAIDKIVIETGK